MSITIRYLHGFRIKDSFIEFVNVSKSTTGKALAETIKGRLTHHELDTENPRGQGFDGAANMRGHIKGVQAEIAKVQPIAIYTHCYAHLVILVIKNAVEVECIQKFYGEVNKIGKYFGAPNRRNFLQETFGCPRDIVIPHSEITEKYVFDTDFGTAVLPLAPTTIVNPADTEIDESEYETE
ncbi:hypothetical protein RvY_18084 [Ramazzottius varieornatus]|uniref:DUF4371 domain-containing protein n=1 Tax=Ramazzottius varieornatus TaxID=947166 RepID=A0A1D1W6B1_RAMVA|nr:hypothetical protein RvY_18084 [Ramazzottius varieornatus]